jgi:hypothetical protein
MGAINAAFFVGLTTRFGAKFTILNRFNNWVERSEIDHGALIDCVSV